MNFIKKYSENIVAILILIVGLGYFGFLMVDIHNEIVATNARFAEFTGKCHSMNGDIFADRCFKKDSVLDTFK